MTGPQPRPAASPGNSSPHGGPGHLVRVRRGSGADAPSIRVLSRHAFAPWGEGGDMVPAWLSHPGVTAFVAEIDGRFAGFMMIGLVPVLGGGWRMDAEVLAIAVEPSYRRSGVASRLVEDALAWVRGRAAELPITRVALSTAVDNLAAQALFQRWGFRFAGRRRGYYTSGHDAWRMVLKVVRRG